MARVWKITGYDGASVLFERTLPESALSEAEMEVLLQRLVAQDLNSSEIVAASLRKNAPEYRSDFEIAKNTGGKYALLTNGSGRHYTAVIEDK
jgi:hypothetical protein